jgi:hypothetical protein
MTNFTSHQPETINQLKFQFFPDIFKNYTKDFFFDTVWQRFPNGRRRRRDIMVDPTTGQQYEKYDGLVEEIANEPLDNEVDDDDEFDDEFEEDKIERKLMEEIKNQPQNNFWSENKEKPDLSSSRWSIYDGFVQALDK